MENTKTNEGEVKFAQCVSRGCGIDVHKSIIVATIAGSGLSKQTRKFSATTRSLTELKEWLLENRITRVAMESTGVYWKPVYNVLEPSGLSVWIVNARHVKNVPGHKTDKKDSSWICKLLLAGLLRPSYIPPREQRDLRDLTRYRKRLIESISSNKNRIIRVLEEANIKLSSVLSDTDGVVANKLINKLCENGKVTMCDIEEVYHSKLRSSKEDIYEACEGIFRDHHLYFLGVIRNEIESTRKNIDVLNARIKRLLSPYDNILDLLKKVPGIGSKSAEDLVAEIGLDMSVFPSEKHISSWVGICPGNNESAGKKKSGRITPGNKQAKTTLTEIAWSASRSKGTFYNARYHKLAARRGKKRAIIALGHSILKSVYNILKYQCAYNELGEKYLLELTEEKRKKYLKNEFSKLGYKVTLIEKSRDTA